MSITACPTCSSSSKETRRMTTSGTRHVGHLWPSIKPSFQAQDNWCGPAVVQAVLQSHGTYVAQSEIADALSTGWSGTRSARISSYLASHGVNAPLRYHHLVPPCIVCCHAYGTTHYMILIKQTFRRMYFMDPASETGYGHMSTSDFYDRWTDRWSIELPAVFNGGACVPEVPV